ncbi:MAG: transaldolase [Sterolibacteriaceae bacterium MAG5]|nr:transaldolase [Candidatus Nitricoxidireducens bremensis]
MKIKLFADGADIKSMEALSKHTHISGFTTNPTLMRKAGVDDYERFAAEVLRIIPDRPLSFEVFADDFPTMERQARVISSWGKNVYVKIPVTNTQGESACPLIERLSADGIPLNITAILTVEQVAAVARVLDKKTKSIVSVFAGRIADTGVDPVPVMSRCVSILADMPNAELLWASPRELLNIIQADEIGCHIITATPDILGKLPTLGKDLTAYSRETVEMFYRDAKASAYNIKL